METNDEGILICREFNPEAVVLADGDYPSSPEACAVLADAPFVACCDGAVDAFVAHGGEPQLIVGDGDSISEENRSRYCSIIRKIYEQENNDRTKTMLQLKGMGYTRVAIVGATGKREDHTLGNISLLMEYKRMGLDVRMVTDFGTFIPLCGSCELESFARQQVSIFNFGATGFSSKGLQYPIYDFTSWWQGSLNQVTGDRFSLSANGSYIIFLSHTPK